jgi:hypothetical protein
MVYNQDTVQEGLNTYSKGETIMKNAEIHIMDSMKGTVVWCSAKGVFLDLENGYAAYANFGVLPKGTEIFCTVLKKPTQRYLTLVTIDAVSENTRNVA